MVDPRDPDIGAPQIGVAGTEPLSGRRTMVVLLPAPGEDVSALSARLHGGRGDGGGAGAVVLAGHGRTLMTLGCGSRRGAGGWKTGPARHGGAEPEPAPSAPHEVTVVGEPYAALARLALDPEFLERSLGTVLVGPLLDPSHYRTPLDKGWPAPRRASGAGMPLLTSLGCRKRCGYCTMVRAYGRCYSGGAPRRPRPWSDLLAEMTAFADLGVDRFRLLADQFLSSNPAENGDLLELARQWKTGGARRPKLTFTGGPREVVRNKPLLAEMASAFDLLPRLSVDSLDEETLRLLDLDFDAPTALEAVAFLGSLGLPLRINYIFVRPGLTPHRLGKELRRLLAVTEATSHLAYDEKLVLCHDVFSRRLDVLEGSSVAEKGVSPRYEAELPAAVLGPVVAVQEAVRGLVEKRAFGVETGVHPLAVAVEAGLRALGES